MLHLLCKSLGHANLRLNRGLTLRLPFVLHKSLRLPFGVGVGVGRNLCRIRWLGQSCTSLWRILLLLAVRFQSGVPLVLAQQYLPGILIVLPEPPPEHVGVAS